MNSDQMAGLAQSQDAAMGRANIGAEVSRKTRMDSLLDHARQNSERLVLMADWLESSLISLRGDVPVNVEVQDSKPVPDGIMGELEFLAEKDSHYTDKIQALLTELQENI